MQDITTAAATDLQAAAIIQHYPCECQLKELWTFDQLAAWFEGRYHKYLISRCWKARFSGEKDPLYPLYKARRISKLVYELIWLEVEYLEQLWGLCQFVYPILAELSQGTETSEEFLSVVDSPLVLFKAVVAEKANADIQYSFEYVEFSSRKLSKALKLTAKALRGEITAKEQRTLGNLTKTLKHSSAWSLIISVAAYLAPKSAVVKAKLTATRMAFAVLSDKKGTQMRRSQSWGWDNGCLMRGNANGTYSFLPNILNKT